MIRTHLILIALLFLSFSCTQKEKRSYKPPVAEKKNVGPSYKSFYHPDSVLTEKIHYSGLIDPITAIKLIVNSHKEIKADYLNYLMDTYKTATPEDSKLEPLFDAEHIGQFIVWQYVNGHTEGLTQIFKTIYQVFKNGDEETRLQIIRYGILQKIILESREYDVNYNSAYLSWIGSIGKEFYDLLDEMESGRS